MLPTSRGVVSHLSQVHALRIGQKMADKLEVIKWDDPRLSKVCDKVDETEFGDKLHEFGEQLIATMRAENGVGLAAPQVGILKRIS